MPICGSVASGADRRPKHVAELGREHAGLPGDLTYLAEVLQHDDERSCRDHTHLRSVEDEEPTAEYQRECEILHFGSNSLGNTLRCAARCSGSVILVPGLHPDSSHHRAGAVDHGFNVSEQSNSVVTLMHSALNPMLRVIVQQQT